MSRPPAFQSNFPSENGMPAEAQHLPMPDGCILQRRNDGAVLVRVPSRRRQAAPLPDAVFTFRAGDPQFDFWHQQLAQQEAQQQ